MFSRPLRASFGFYFPCPPRRCGWPSDPSTRLSRRCSEGFLIHSWLCRARRCGWLSSPRGFITTAVAGNLRLLVFFSIADVLYIRPRHCGPCRMMKQLIVTSVAGGVMMGAVHRCGGFQAPSFRYSFRRRPRYVLSHIRHCG